METGLLTPCILLVITEGCVAVTCVQVPPQNIVLHGFYLPMHLRMSRHVIIYIFKDRKIMRGPGSAGGEHDCQNVLSEDKRAF